jgi:hypothetical protein
MRAEAAPKWIGRMRPSPGFPVTVRMCGFAVNQLLVTGPASRSAKKGVNRPLFGGNSDSPMKQN